MSMTLKQLCDAALQREGMAVEPKYVEATSEQGLRVYRIALEEGHAQARRHDWSILTRAWVAYLHSGASSTSPYRLRKVVPGTMFNTTDREIIPEITEREYWDEFYSASGTIKYYVSGGTVYLVNLPSDGEFYYFQHVSDSWAGSPNTYSTEFTSDTDEHHLDDEAFILGIRWRLLASQGFEHQHVFAEYENRIRQLIANDGFQRQVITMGDAGESNPASWRWDGTIDA